MKVRFSAAIWALLSLAAIVAFFVLLPFMRIQPGHELGTFNIGADNEVVEIRMSSPVTGPIELKHAGDNKWLLNDTLDANDAAVRELLGALRQMAIRMPVPTHRSDSVFMLLEQNGVLVEVFVRHYLLNLSDEIKILPVKRRAIRFRVGNDCQQNLGTYMHDYRSTTPVIVHLPGMDGGLATLFETNIHIWRSPVVLDLNPHQIGNISVTFPGMLHESFEIHFNGPKFTLSRKYGNSPGEHRIDSTRVQRYFKSFTELYYHNLLDASVDKEILERKHSEAFFTITVQDDSEGITTLEFYRKKLPPGNVIAEENDRGFDPNLFFIHINHNEWALANYFVFNRIIRQYSFFVIPE